MASAAELAIIIKARDQASGVLGGIQSKMGSLGASARNAGIGLTAGLTLPIIGLGAASVKAFSDQNEAINKASVVFGQHVGVVSAFAASSAKDFGISKRAANEYAGTIGTILDASGVAADASAEMSVNVVKLAADLASFNNIPIDQALEKIRSGLVGEAEPLRTVGVLLSEAAVKQQAYTSGIAEQGAELTEGQKVQARYALILAQTQTAQGDFARTSDGLANQQRILTARFEDTRAKLGQELIPVMTMLMGVALQGLGVFERMIGVFSSLPEPVQTGIIAFAGVLAVIGPLLVVLGTLASGFSALIALAPILGTAFTLMLGPVGVIILTLIALIAIGVLVWKNWDEIKAKAGEIWEQIKNIFWGFVSWVKDHWLQILIGVLGGPAILAIFLFRDDIMAAIDKIIAFFTGMPGRIVDALGDLGSLLFDAGKKLIQGFIDGIKSIPVPNPLDLVPGGGIVKGAASAVGGLLGFQHGGMVPGPSGAPRLIMAHGGERVLTAAQQGGGGGAGVTIQNTFQIMSDMTDAAIDKLARKVEEAQNASLRLTGLRGSSVGPGLPP